jgi:predicted small lipoprotein YifL
MKRTRLNAQDAVVSQRTQGGRALGGLRASSAYSALSLLKVTLALALAIGIAGCGTKTELLKPDGKPTPRDERDPSQPPSPISR